MLAHKEVSNIFNNNEGFRSLLVYWFLGKFLLPQIKIIKNIFVD